jgi:hypothetical protein
VTIVGITIGTFILTETLASPVALVETDLALAHTALDANRVAEHAAV